MNKSDTPLKLLLGVAILTTVILSGSLWLLKQSGPKAVSAGGSPSELTTQEKVAGEVTVEMTPVQVEVGRTMIFQVAFDTHTLELDFDAAEIASGLDGQKNSYRFTWTGDGAGGHHRTGVLTSTKPLEQTETIKLSFAGIGGQELTEFAFRW